MDDKTDPICGMQGSIETHGHYFCSQECISEYERKHNLKPKGIKGKGWYKPVLYAGYMVLAVALIASLRIFDVMIPFMGWFFIAVAILKFIDWKGFARAFAMYDIVAKRSKGYAYAYPFIELGLGIAYVLSWQIQFIAIITFVIMTVGSIGVARNLLAKNPVKCACLGTRIKLPLTKFTLVEDITMAIMALMILFF